MSFSICVCFTALIGIVYYSFFNTLDLYSPAESSNKKSFLNVKYLLDLTFAIFFALSKTNNSLLHLVGYLISFSLSFAGAFHYLGNIQLLSSHSKAVFGIPLNFLLVLSAYFYLTQNVTNIIYNGHIYCEAYTNIQFIADNKTNTTKKQSKEAKAKDIYHKCIEIARIASVDVLNLLLMFLPIETLGLEQGIYHKIEANLKMKVLSIPVAKIYVYGLILFISCQITRQFDLQFFKVEILGKDTKDGETHQNETDIDNVIKIQFKEYYWLNIMLLVWGYAQLVWLIFAAKNRNILFYISPLLPISLATYFLVTKLRK